MLDHDARYPATRIVFDPGQRFDDSLVARRVVEAPDAVPAAPQRPLRGDVDLRDLVAQVAVAEIHRMQRTGLIAAREREALGPCVARVVLLGRLDRPVARRAPG